MLMAATQNLGQRQNKSEKLIEYMSQTLLKQYTISIWIGNKGAYCDWV